MVQRICDNNQTEADAKKWPLPLSQLTVSPPAASNQHHRQDQVTNWTRYIYDELCYLFWLFEWMFKNSFQCQDVMCVIYGFYFWWTLCTEFSQPPVQWYRELFPRNKAAGTSNHSPPSSAEINNGWSCTSALPHDFMTCTVNKLVVFLTLRDSKRI